MASINLTWTASNPVPVNGYRIKYWRTTNPGTVFTVSPNVTGSAYTITGLQDGSNYTGTIEASCSGGAYSTPVTWSVNAVAQFYYYFATTFNCSNNCAQLSADGSVVVVSSTMLSVGLFYKMNSTVYRLDSAEPWTNSAVDITNYTGSGNSCSTACGSGSSGSTTYTYWDMAEVNCFTGTTITPNVTVLFTGTFTPTPHRYYKPIGGGNSIYYNNIANEAPSAIGPILSTNAFTNYLDACNSNTLES